MKRALIVEDDLVWAKVLEGYCRKAGLTSVCVRSPQEAMDQLDSGGINIVILDMLLATETGMALLNEIRGYGDLAEIPVIVCTASHRVSFDAFKPFGVIELFDKATMEPQDVIATLRRVLL